MEQNKNFRNIFCIIFYTLEIIFYYIFLILIYSTAKIHKIYPIYIYNILLTYILPFNIFCLICFFHLTSLSASLVLFKKEIRYYYNDKKDDNNKFLRIIFYYFFFIKTLIPQFLSYNLYSFFSTKLFNEIIDENYKRKIIYQDNYSTFFMIFITLSDLIYFIYSIIRKKEKNTLAQLIINFKLEDKIV